MSAEYGMGLVFGICIAAAGWFVVRRILHRGECREEMDYDERQQAARGRAYLKGYRALVLSAGVYAMLDVFDVRFCRPYVAVWLCILLSVVVFALTVIRNDAYLSMRTNPKSWMILYALIGGLNLVRGGLSAARGHLVEADGLGTAAVSLSIGVAFGIILIAALLHQRRSGKGEEE